MSRSVHAIQRGIAIDAQQSDAHVPMGTKGLVEFLREQIIEAEWSIARAQAEIKAYEQAIEAISAKAQADPASAPPATG